MTSKTFPPNYLGRQYHGRGEPGEVRRVQAGVQAPAAKPVLRTAQAVNQSTNQPINHLFK